LRVAKKATQSRPKRVVARPAREGDVVTTSQARLLLMNGARLLNAPAATATRGSILKLINELGFVQLDSIHIVERAHHHILWSRNHAYTQLHLESLQQRGEVFEHWTHDASFVPTKLFPYWKHRFERVSWAKWFGHMLGSQRETLLNHVRERIENEGPLMARDFDREHVRPAGSGGWWDWKPAKTALEYLWRRGELAIPRRENFHKVYDLTHRVLPDVHGCVAPSADEHLRWACESAMERLGVATATDIARFWNAVSIAQARAWCDAHVKSGEIVRVRVETCGGESTAAFAIANWKQRVKKLPEPAEVMRVLSPFDPVMRDRARCLRLFGFDYRFEAFTPAAKRKFGYYVLPILWRDRLVARIDAAMDREHATLRVNGSWWEPGCKTDAALKTRLEEAVEKYAIFCGADRVSWPARKQSSLP
jgi:uncharacterized protein